MAVSAKPAPPKHCGHPDGPRERRGVPPEFDGLCDSCLSGWLDAQRRGGVFIAFSGKDGSNEPSWLQRLRLGRRAVTGRSSRTMHRVAVQGYAQARQAGRVMASRVISMQRAARLPGYLMRNSARAVIDRPGDRRSGLAGRQGYRQAAEVRVVGPTHGPGPVTPPAPAEPAAPAWPPAGPDREAGR